MLAVAGALPADDDSWSYEVKWDGARALVVVDAGNLTLTSRNGNDVTSHYPELRGLPRQLGSRSALLDAEIVAVSPEGRSDFGLLQARMHVAEPSAARRAATPVQLMVFDVLHLEGGSLLAAGYDQRREVLEGLGLQGEHWSVPAAFVGGGQALLDATREQKLEGIIAKRRDARYLPGRRSDCWLKIKHIRRTCAVIAGWKPGEGGRAGRIGSLLLGVQGPGGLEYAGHVGTGFTAATLAQLGALLEPTRIAESAFTTAVPRMHAKDAVWVQPRLVAEIDYTEWTRDGRLRHPSYKGLRDDYDPKDVVRD
ncbi:MAG: hypothetical protein NVSMB55_21650 [Mycobacteriales bacterium]